MGLGMAERVLAVVLALVLLATAPALAETVLFGPGSDQISSLGVLDMAQERQGTLYFATDNGLSIYDGTWRIAHMTHGNTSQGLLSDHVLAVEFDPQGNLWLGYPNGIQRIEGGTFVTIRDQQMLKSLEAHSLLLANGWMWVATGTAGLHRYRDGAWQWFKPQGPEGLGCNYVRSLAGDSSGKTLYVACNEGIWYTANTDGPVAFKRLAGGLLGGGTGFTLREDPFGGIYIFNSTAVLRYSPVDGARVILAAEDLMIGIDIRDIAVDPDGTLWVATGNGIYGWKYGEAREHLDSSNGIRNNAVKWLYMDAGDRLWFVTPENVGYYQITPQRGSAGEVIPIETFPVQTQAPLSYPAVTPSPSVTPDISFTEIAESPVVTPSNPLADLLAAIGDFFGKLFHR
jgi:ligand-binding sensor domain-containing protein